MPIFEYVCDECAKPFEKMILNRAEKVACPACGSERHTLQFSIVSAPAKNPNGGEFSGGCGCTPSSCGCG